MKQKTYEVEAIVEDSHWWFWGRRELFASKLSNLDFDEQVTVLDIGTGTGTNLRLLKSLGFKNVVGLDKSSEAARFCREKKLGDVQIGDVCNIPFKDQEFHLIFATDILEHVDDDVKALKEIFRVLKKGGAVLITVPTFESLWGLQDEVSLHRRRYLIGELKEKILQCEFEILDQHYFNYLLFFPIWFMRVLMRLLKIKLDSENQINNSIINWILKIVFFVDIQTAPWFHPPIGVSAIIIARKR